QGRGPRRGPRSAGPPQPGPGLRAPGQRHPGPARASPGEVARLVGAPGHALTPPAVPLRLSAPRGGVVKVNPVAFRYLLITRAKRTGPASRPCRYAAAVRWTVPRRARG